LGRGCYVGWGDPLHKGHPQRQDKDRLIQLIVTTVETRVHKGDAFRAPNTKMDSISSVQSVDVPEHQ